MVIWRKWAFGVRLATSWRLLRIFRLGCWHYFWRLVSSIADQFAGTTLRPVMLFFPQEGAFHGQWNTYARIIHANMSFLLESLDQKTSLVTWLSGRLRSDGAAGLQQMTMALPSLATISSLYAVSGALLHVHTCLTVSRNRLLRLCRTKHTLLLCLIFLLLTDADSCIRRPKSLD